MKKLEEFNKAIEEFQLWFPTQVVSIVGKENVVVRNKYYRMVLLRSKIESDPTEIAQLYQDLKDFEKEHSNFYKSGSRNILRFVNPLEYGFSIGFYLKKNGSFDNKMDVLIHLRTEKLEIKSPDSLNLFRCYFDFLVQQSERFNQLLELKEEADVEVENEKIRQEKIREAEELKQKKIREIQEKSIEVWIKTVMQDRGYSYKIENKKTNVLITVKINSKQQLEIPLNHESFQKIIPHVLETIQQYEEFAKKTKVRTSLVKIGVNN